VYSRLVIVMTLAALVVLPLLGVPLLSQGGQRGAVYRAMGLLTTASPCALVLVRPLPSSMQQALARTLLDALLLACGRMQLGNVMAIQHFSCYGGHGVLSGHVPHEKPIGKLRYFTLKRRPPCCGT
jgi:hypothetical protein